MPRAAVSSLSDAASRGRWRRGLLLGAPLALAGGYWWQRPMLLTGTGSAIIIMDFGKPLTPEQTAAYLRTLPAIRERCWRVHALAKECKRQYFTYHPEKEADVAAFCVDIMKVRINALDADDFQRLSRYVCGLHL